MNFIIKTVLTPGTFYYKGSKIHGPQEDLRRIDRTKTVDKRCSLNYKNTFSVPNEDHPYFTVFIKSFDGTFKI